MSDYEENFLIKEKYEIKHSFLHNPTS